MNSSPRSAQLYRFSRDWPSAAAGTWSIPATPGGGGWSRAFRTPALGHDERAGGPTANTPSPPGNALARELRGAGLADDRDADLAGVGELLLDLLGDVAGDDLGLDVVYLLGLDHDADLAARLHGEDLLDAFLLGSD